MNPQLVYILNTLHRAKSKRIIEQLKQVTEEHDDDREQNSFPLQGNKTDWDSSVRKRCNVEDDTIDVSRTSSCVKKVKSISCFSVGPT